MTVIALPRRYPDIFSVIRYFAEALHNKMKVRELEKDSKGSTDFMIGAKAAEALDMYGNTILRVAYSYLHNMSDAEDILQDTLLQYIRTNPSFENDNHEKAWLITVASNLSKNKITYQKRRSCDELSEELVSEDKEDLSFVWEAIKKLPVKNREVIHLFYQEGYSTKEIADILKRRESTVRSDLKRGRERLKKILKEAYDFE